MEKGRNRAVALVWTAALMVGCGSNPTGPSDGSDAGPVGRGGISLSGLLATQTIHAVPVVRL